MVLNRLLGSHGINALVNLPLSSTALDADSYIIFQLQAFNLPPLHLSKAF